MEIILGHSEFLFRQVPSPEFKVNVDPFLPIFGRFFTIPLTVDFFLALFRPFTFFHDVRALCRLGECA